MNEVLSLLLRLVNLYKLKKIFVCFLRSYSLDLRALSLLRIGLALIILTDLAIRVGDLTAHYTDNGIWPVELMHNFGWKPGFWSIHELGGEYWWVLTLFIFHFIFAASFLLGYKTKLSGLIVWLLYISLHNRNVFIQQGGDDVLRIILFWGLFLPWNSHYSIDSRKIKYKPKQKYVANFGYMLLIASIYFFTVCLKTSAEWGSERTAVYYALSLEQLRLPGFGDWLYQFPGLMKALTFMVYYSELIIPFLILFPAKKGYLRLLAFFLILFLHTGIGLTLYVGLFFIINMVSGIGLLPKFVMDKLENKFKFLQSLTFYYPTKNKVNKKPILAWLTNAVCIIIICLCATVNLSAVKWFNYELRSETIVPINALRLDQYWGMFSPSVLKKDGWYVYYGMDSIGRQWDLIRNEDYVNFEKPKSILKIHTTDRWRKITENMQRDEMAFMRPLYCNYILKRWNKRHPEKKMFTLKLYYMQKESLLNYKTTPVEKILYCLCNDYKYAQVR